MCLSHGDTYLGDQQQVPLELTQLTPRWFPLAWQPSQRLSPSQEWGESPVGRGLPAPILLLSRVCSSWELPFHPGLFGFHSALCGSVGSPPSPQR